MRPRGVPDGAWPGPLLRPVAPWWRMARDGYLVPMARLLFEGVVHTDYRQFDLTWGEDAFAEGGDASYAGQENGLVGAADPTGLQLVLGRRSGGSSVRIELWAEEPPADARWEDVVEVSFVLPEHREMLWESWGGEQYGSLDGVPAGDLRLRVSAFGRDAGADNEFAEEVVDFYLLQMWPAPAQPDPIVRVGSADAEYWHREAVGNR